MSSNENMTGPEQMALASLREDGKPDWKELGICPRYDVKRRWDPEGKHDDCRYFVLDPQHDPGARLALTTYKSWAEANGYQALADDIARLLEETAA